MTDWARQGQFGAFSGASATITGGAGFIGSHIGTALRQLGARVTVLDDLSGGYRHNVPEGARLIEASILEPDALAEAVAGADYVFHEAAMVSVPESVENPARCAEINTLGLQRVLTACETAGVKRLVFAASAAAYGDAPSLPSSETDTPHACSPYAASKVAGELLCQSASATGNLSTVSLRYFNVFGPRQDPTSAYAAVISAFSDRLLTGRPVTIFGDGRQTRDFVYIDNVVQANLLAASCERDMRGEVMNIGCGRRVSLLEVLAVMADALGVEATPSFASARPGDVRDSVAKIDLARELIGYEPMVGFEEGLQRTIRWAQAAAA